MMKKQWAIFISLVLIMSLNAMKRSRQSSDLPLSPAERRMRQREEARLAVELETSSRRSHRLLFSGLDSTVEQLLWDADVDSRIKQDFMNGLTPDQVGVINIFTHASTAHRVQLSEAQKEIYDRFPDFVKAILLRYLRNYPLEIREESATEVDGSGSDNSDDEVLLIDEEASSLG